MDRIELVDLAAVHRELATEIEAAIRRVCENSTFIGGPEVEAFEQEWAEYTGARHAIGVANGTDALELVLRSLDLPPGGEVLLPANTFIATAEAIEAAGLICRFVDVEPDTGLLDVELCREALDERICAIVPVHLYGRLADMSPLLALAAEHGLAVVEDAAQAHGARRGGAYAGTFGVAGTFSFYPGKNLGAFGDAGAVITDDDALAERVRLLRDHGRSGHGHAVVGRNSRLDGLQAAVLRAKLPALEAWTAARRSVAMSYRERLDSTVLDWLGDQEPEAESHHIFPVLVDGRDELAVRLAAEGIATGVHYRVPLPATDAFRACLDECPVADLRARRQLSLPIYPQLTEGQVERVVRAVAACATAPA
jgi:dTDP-4-amino-4,6-dideoxygalactose transaminase